MFQGATSLSMDVKGRVIVPIRHRSHLEQHTVNKLVITAHPHRCLLLYPDQAWSPIRARIMSFSSFDPRASAWKRVLVGFAEEIQIDAAGRLLISPTLRKFADLKKQLMLIGQGSHFEIWSEELWEKQLGRLSDISDEDLPKGLESFSL